MTAKYEAWATVGIIVFIIIAGLMAWIPVFWPDLWNEPVYQVADK
jgi:hypothetical protein